MMAGTLVPQRFAMSDIVSPFCTLTDAGRTTFSPDDGGTAGGEVCRTTVTAGAADATFAISGEEATADGAGALVAAGAGGVAAAVGAGDLRTFSQAFYRFQF